MITEFQSLDDTQVELALKAPILICILIAGADGTIKPKEIREARVFAEQNRSHDLLAGYFQGVSEDFEDKVMIILQGYPNDTAARNQAITDELSGLNKIFGLLDKRLAITFYNMLIALAARIAESSGGLLGMRSIDAEEAKLMTLPMLIDPSKN